jgi:cyclic pyranopterin phosphate synthase
VLDRLRRLEPALDLVPLAKTHPGETSERWAWSDGNGAVGFINAVTRPFCGDCSRVRLGPDGRLYTCLFSARGRDLKPFLGNDVPVAALADELARVWSGRADRYSETRTDGAGDRVEMFAVGG